MAAEQPAGGGAGELGAGGLPAPAPASTADQRQPARRPGATGEPPDLALGLPADVGCSGGHRVGAGPGSARDGHADQGPLDVQKAGAMPPTASTSSSPQRAPAPAGPGRLRLAPPRQRRRPALVALALLLILVGGVAATALYLRA